MTQTAAMDATRIIEWRANIRRDIEANYALGMAIAIYHSSGAAAALSRLHEFTAHPDQETVRQILMSHLLRDLGREEEADTILRSLQQIPPDRRVDGLIELIGITTASAGMEDFTETLVEQAVELLCSTQSPQDRVIMLAIRSLQHLRRGRNEQAITDIQALCATPVSGVPAEEIRFDILSELAGHLARQRRNDLAVAIDIHTLAMFHNPDRKAPAPLPGPQQTIQRLIRLAPPILDGKVISDLLPSLLEHGDWSDPGLLDTLAPMGVALLNRDLLLPLEQVRTFLEGLGETAHPYRLWLLAEILACDPTPGRHAALLENVAASLPENPHLLLAIARACLTAGCLEEAGILAARAVKYGQVHLLSLNLQTTLAILAGDSASVPRLCDRLRTQPYGDHQAFNQQAMALLSAGAAGQAMALIEKRGVDNLPWVRLLRGLALRALNRPSEAQEEARQLAGSLSDNALRRLVNLARPVREAALLLLREAGVGEGLYRNIVTIASTHQQ